MYENETNTPAICCRAFIVTKLLWFEIQRRKLQAAGITPIITGGADKWPLHFYWSHLAIRVGGKPAFEAALRGEGKGFADETFVRAGELFKQLADLKPFQQGYLGTTFPQSAGMFGDGKGAMQLQLNGMLGSMAANSADKVGIPDDKLGWFPFPRLSNGLDSVCAGLSFVPLLRIV